MKKLYEMLSTSPPGYKQHLKISLLCQNLAGYIVGRFNLAAEDEEDEVWSIVLHKSDWAMLLWTLTHAPQEFMKVEIANEGLLNANLE